MPKRYAGGIITATFKPLDPHGDNNSLYVWGNGYIGEMGLNDRFVGRSSPVLVDSGVTWSKVFGSANANWRLAIKQNGTMWAWGQNDDGQLGNNTTSKRSSPTQIGTLTTWVTGTVGGSSGGSTAAIKTDGSLWTWGKSAFGELGSNSVASRSSPVQVGSTPTAQTTTWSRINSGSTSYNFGSIKTDGSLWVWGFNGDGTLGLNSSGAKSSPVQLGTLTDWSSFSSGAVSLAVRTNGTLYGFGYNTQGQVGDNTRTARSSPVQIGSGTTWSVVSAGIDFSAAIKTDGTLWLWGNNTYGQLGSNDRVARSSPAQVGAGITWSKISAQAFAMVAVKTDGTMWSWGRNNDFRSLGLDDNVDRSSPVQVGSLSTWSKIASGYNHFLAIKTDGSLWGVGPTAPVGQNNAAAGTFSSPVQIGADTDWYSISAGNSRSSATKNNGTLWTWGSGDSGQNGNNSEAGKSSPSQVGAFTNWSYLAEGGYATVGAIKTDGTLWTFGYGNRGSIGDNTSERRSSPVQVGAQVYGWSLVSRGGYVSAAIKADGTLWAWGRNQVGQLGQNDTVLRSSPVQVGTDTNWSKVSVAANSILAIKTDNSLWVWGYQDQGVLGINSVTPVSSPVQVGATTDWSLISATRYHAGAIKTNGTFWTWGQSTNHGQLGLGDRVNRSSPVQLGSDTNWSQVSAGTNTTAATKTIGTLYVWGDGRHGEMGNSSEISRSSPIQVGSLTSWADVSVGSDDSAQAIFAISSIPF